MPEPRTLTERYQESATSMGKYMREAGEHIGALSLLDLDPSELIDEIESITVMLHEASFYAGRMKAYARLMSQDRAVFKDKG